MRKKTFIEITAECDSEFSKTKGSLYDISMMPSQILNLSLKYLSVFSPNAKKYGPEKTPYLDTFYAVYATFAAYINIEINA